MDRMPDNGRVILLSEADTTLARVISRQEGFTVKEQKILIDDLLNAMLAMVEPSELTKFIMKNDDVVNEIVEPAISNLTGASLSKALGMVVERAQNTEDLALVADLFKAVARKFDLNVLDEQSFNGFLQYLFLRVQGFKNDDDFAELFLLLLSKVELASRRKKELTRGVLSALQRFENDEAKEFFNQIAAEFVPKVKTVSTPILPKGTVLYQEESDGTKIVVLERERARRDVIFHNTPYSQVGHPKLLFAFIVKGNRIMECQVVAVKDVTLKPKSKLFRYPFSNVYNSNRACWPELKEINIKNLFEIQNLPDLFFSSPANNDLFEGVNLREWFFKLQNKDFDDKELKPLGVNVQDFFEMFKSAAAPLMPYSNDDETFDPDR